MKKKVMEVAKWFPVAESQLVLTANKIKCQGHSSRPQVQL